MHCMKNSYIHKLKQESERCRTSWTVTLYLCAKHSVQSCFKFSFHLVQFVYTQPLKVFTSHQSTVSNSEVICYLQGSSLISQQIFFESHNQYGTKHNLSPWVASASCSFKPEYLLWSTWKLIRKKGLVYKLNQTLINYIYIYTVHSSDSSACRLNLEIKKSQTY